MIQGRLPPRVPAVARLPRLDGVLFVASWFGIGSISRLLCLLPPPWHQGPELELVVLARRFFGSIAYSVTSLYEFGTPITIFDDSSDISSPVSCLRLSLMCANTSVLGTGATVKEFEIASHVPFNHVSSVSSCRWDELRALPLPHLESTKHLGRRIDWDSLVHSQPPRASVERWRRESGISRLPARAQPQHPAEALSPADAAALELPRTFARTDAMPKAAPRTLRGKPLKPEQDAMKMLDALAFSLKLRQRAELSDALDEAHRYNCEGDEEPEPRDRSHDPAKSTIDRAKAKADLVGALIERRLFAAEVAADDIESIHCFSDGSPVVGSEIQGMIAEVVHRDHSVREITLPGSTLHYGKCDAVNKCVVFLWALWLVVGPLRTMMEIFIEKTLSFTTDGGVEIGLVLTPDILGAFMAWVGGQELSDCRLLVQIGSRLFFSLPSNRGMEPHRGQSDALRRGAGAVVARHFAQGPSPMHVVPERHLESPHCPRCGPACSRSC